MATVFRTHGHTPSHALIVLNNQTELAFCPHISFCPDHASEPARHTNAQWPDYMSLMEVETNRGMLGEDGANRTSAHISRPSIEIGQERVNWPCRSEIVKWGFSSSSSLSLCVTLKSERENAGTWTSVWHLPKALTFTYICILQAFSMQWWNRIKFLDHQKMQTSSMLQQWFPNVLSDVAALSGELSTL